MVRVGKDAHDELVTQPGAPHLRHVRGGRCEAGSWSAPEGFATDADLGTWIQRGAVYAGSLPAK